MSSNFYVILGVSRDADLPRIRRAYQRMVRHYLPAEIRQQIEAPRQRMQRRGPTPLSAPRRRPSTAPRQVDVTDEFFGGWVPGVYTSGRMASRRKDLYVELILEPQEASRGGLFPLNVPVERTCVDCDGTGWRGNVVCPDCHDAELTHHEIKISVPPGVRHGERARLSLADIGLSDVDLNVLVSIGR